MPLPKIRPLRPERSKVVPVGREWVYELKLDGFRAVFSVEDGRAFFTSKTGNVMRLFQGLADTLARTLPVKNAIFDGEIIVMREDGPTSTGSCSGAAGLLRRIRDPLVER